MSVFSSCILQTQYSFSCYLRQRLRVCVKLLPFIRHCLRYTIQLHFTLDYHPKNDGQTECTNQTFKQYFWVYYNYQQNNWSELLPLAEFAYNNAPSVTTGISLFFSNKGYYSNITVYPEHDIASSQAHNFTVDLNELQSTLKAEISIVQQHYQKSTDVQHFPAPDFKVSNKVFVKAQFFQTTRPLKKLSEKYLGLYEIITQSGTLLFTLCLLESMYLSIQFSICLYLNLLYPTLSLREHN